MEHNGILYNVLNRLTKFWEGGLDILRIIVLCLLLMKDLDNRIWKIIYQNGLKIMHMDKLSWKKIVKIVL